tara:strand:- start:516 stop:1250 length:735 start_codon:yes stop_codon:yes gene_type:complete
MKEGKILNPLIVSCCTEDYFDMLYAMVKSGLQNIKSPNFYIELINITEDKCLKLEKLSPNIEILKSNIKFKNDTQKKCYSTNSRAKLLYEKRKSPQDILTWVDADSLILKDISEMLSELIKNNYDLGIVLRPNASKSAGARGGFYCVCHKNPNGLKFLENYYKKVSRLNLWQSIKSNDLKKHWKIWMANQDVLNKYFYNPKELKIKKISNLFCDVRLKEESFIWAAKNKLKTSEKYLTELKKYN